MFSLELTKPDGRGLTLYSRRPIDPNISAPSPFAEPLSGSPHLRWHPLRGEWVTYAAYRQGRTFLPPPNITRWRSRPIRHILRNCRPETGTWRYSIIVFRLSLYPARSLRPDRAHRASCRLLRGSRIYPGSPGFPREAALGPHRSAAAGLGRPYGHARPSGRRCVCAAV